MSVWVQLVEWKGQLFAIGGDDGLTASVHVRWPWVICWLQMSLAATRNPVRRIP